MTEFIVSWSAYGPSGRIQALNQAEATAFVRRQLEAVGVGTKVDSNGEYAGDFIVLHSLVRRYGDMASFGVCVYPVGGTSFYDKQRDQLEAQKSVRETQEIANANR